MRQLSEPRSSILYARRFGWLWRGLAFLVLFVAAALTWLVVAQDPYVEIVPKVVAVFGSYRTGAAANISLQWTPRAKSYQNFWYVKYPRGTSSVVLPGRGPCATGASYAYDPMSRIDSRRVRTVGGYDRTYVQINVAGLGTDEVTCIEDPNAARVSFTRYELAVEFHAKAPRHNLQPVALVRILPNIERAEYLEMRGVPSNGSSADLHFGDTVAIKYSNSVDESKRDILFVVIGALIALGAAMILESLRPAIEASAERWAARQTAKTKA